MRNWLQNEYVLLTGASGGIGRELTKILIKKYGAKVIGIGRREEKMLSLQAELGEDAPSFSYRLFHVEERNAWELLYEELVSRNVHPILLINNAGVFPPLQTDTPIDVIEKTLQTNFLACVYATKHISPLLMREKKYSPGIVNICSSAALCPVVGSAAYSASKSALKGYTETLQLEEKRRTYIGIIYPGTTATDIFRDDENVQNSAMKKIASSPYKMAKKIAQKIYKRKKRAVLGFDAKFMNITAKCMPVKGPAFIRWIMKISKSKAFDNVFKKNR